MSTISNKSAPFSEQMKHSRQNKTLMVTMMSLSTVQASGAGTMDLSVWSWNSAGFHHCTWPTFWPTCFMPIFCNTHYSVAQILIANCISWKRCLQNSFRIIRFATSFCPSLGFQSSIHLFSNFPFCALTIPFSLPQLFPFNLPSFTNCPSVGLNLTYVASPSEF